MLKCQLGIWYYPAMARDYVREIAKAVGDGQPIQELGRRLITEIDRDIRVLSEKGSALQQQVFTIRSLMQMYPEVGTLEAHGQAVATGSVSISAPPPTPDLTSPSVSISGWEPVTGLAEAKKVSVMAEAVAMVRERGLKAKIEPEEFLARLAAKGEPLENVKWPKAVAGSFIYRARERLKRNGNGQGSLLKPAEAGKS
jgi:hypothetical protein